MRIKSLSSSIIEFVNDFKIDGLIITPPLSDMDEFLHDLDNENIEYSIIAPSTKKASSPYVSSNDYDASYEKIMTGHKKLLSRPSTDLMVLLKDIHLMKF